MIFNHKFKIFTSDIGVAPVFKAQLISAKKHLNKYLIHVCQHNYSTRGVDSEGEIFGTAIHCYKWFIEKLYNSKCCIVDNTRLSIDVVPNYLYTIYYTLLGNWDIKSKVTSRGCMLYGPRCLFLFLFFQQIQVLVSWTLEGINESEGWQQLRTWVLCIAIIYFLMSVPCLVIRHRVVRQARNNDRMIDYERQYSRMILVSKGLTSLNQFYEVSMSKFHQILISVGIEVDNANIIAASLHQIKTEDRVLFMLYQPLLRKCVDDAHSSITCLSSYVNWQFYFMPFYQLFIIIYWSYCFVQYQ